MTNPGLDWVNLGNITLEPYVPVLSAYAVGNSGFSAAWVWNRSNVFDPNAGTSVAGTVQVSGLDAGTYSGTWWDTFAGAAISNFTFTVVSSNSPVTLNTPAILRSAALYVGLPPQADVSAPNLNQTLGTNSPALDVPLAIANHGGLPLAYSLSITNPDFAAYRAINSAQPGGPAFTWNDISALGQDISTNFKALAAPKTRLDEGLAGPIDIGFAFPFFTNSFTQLYVSPNGFVTFDRFGGDTSTNTVLPNASAPSNCIAFFWDDLDLNTAGHVYTLADPLDGTFTVQFQNVLFKNTAATVNCQLVLKTTGEILMAYQSMAVSNACTVGVQNADRSQGLTVAYNQNYLQPCSAIRLTPLSWLDLDGNAGIHPGLHLQHRQCFVQPGRPGVRKLQRHPPGANRRPQSAAGHLAGFTRHHPPGDLATNPFRHGGQLRRGGGHSRSRSRRHHQHPRICVQLGSKHSRCQSDFPRGCGRSSHRQLHAHPSGPGGPHAIPRKSPTIWPLESGIRAPLSRRKPSPTMATAPKPSSSPTTLPSVQPRPTSCGF